VLRSGSGSGSGNDPEASGSDVASNGESDGDSIDAPEDSAPLSYVRFVRHTGLRAFHDHLINL